MRVKLFKDIFASSAQIFTNQASSLVIFLITSTYLLKNVYGELNWCIAIITVIISLLSFGMEPIVVKKVAAGDDAREIIGMYILHTLFTGLFFVMVLLLMSFIIPSFFQANSSFILLAVSFLLSYFASPFKQLANGRQWFHYLAAMSVISNLLRAACLLILVAVKSFTLHTVLLIFVFSSLAELLLSAWLMMNKAGAGFKLSWNRGKYYSLVKESLPQLGVTIFSTSLARFDWIFLGIMTTKIITADYSFAYKVFELCTMPLFIIGPLILPKFTRIFNSRQQNNLQEKKEQLFALVRLEIILASFIVLVLNLTWTPVIDSITSNKYGAVNANTIFILSCSMPFLYVTNFLWTINFSQGHLKRILGIIAVTFVLNVVGDIVLIPLWQGTGAAIAFLFAIVIQAIIYMRRTQYPELSRIWLPLIICLGSAIFSEELAMVLFSDYWLAIPFGIILFTGLLIISGQVVVKDWRLLKTALGV